MTTLDLLSIVAPVYNEETNILPFYEALVAVLDLLDGQTEIIFVDDGSTDRSYEIIGGLAQNDDRVRCLRFSRNFGSYTAMMAGLRRAAGDAAVMISVDLQDPPELIPELVRRWQEGFHVVWAVRKGRDDPFLKRTFAALFYRLFRHIALPDYPATGMDFGLFDRCVLESLKDFSELNHFMTGIVVWLGFRQTHVPYRRRARHSGHSKWSVGKQIKNALDAIISFSYFPIRLISYTGLFVSLMSFLYASFLVTRRVFFGLGAPGWPAVMVAVLFLGGVQLTMLGVLGEYIWRGAEQARGRPQYIVMETMGFNQQTTSHSLDVQRIEKGKAHLQKSL